MRSPGGADPDASNVPIKDRDLIPEKLVVTGIGARPVHHAAQRKGLKSGRGLPAHAIDACVSWCARRALNKVSSEIRALAQLSAPDAFAELARLAREAQSEQTRVATIKEVLDRAYGRPTQLIDGDGQGGAVIVNVVTGVRG